MSERTTALTQQASIDEIQKIKHCKWRVSLLLLSQELGSEEWIQKFHYNNVHHVPEGDKVIWLFCKQLPFWGSKF
jgi:hypothetical protein